MNKLDVQMAIGLLIVTISGAFLITNIKNLNPIFGFLCFAWILVYRLFLYKNPRKALHNHKEVWSLEGISDHTAHNKWPYFLDYFLYIGDTHIYFGRGWKTKEINRNDIRNINIKMKSISRFIKRFPVTLTLKDDQILYICLSIDCLDVLKKTFKDRIQMT